MEVVLVLVLRLPLPLVLGVNGPGVVDMELGKQMPLSPSAVLGIVYRLYKSFSSWTSNKIQLVTSTKEAYTYQTQISAAPHQHRMYFVCQILPWIRGDSVWVKIW